MKNALELLCLSAALLFSTFASAQNTGTIIFTGAIVEPTCVERQNNQVQCRDNQQRISTAKYIQSQSVEKVNYKAQIITVNYK